MSKNIKLNETEYNGVSTVQLPTTDGGTATFKDTDEITTPTGSKTITTNGTHDVTNYASAVVNVSTSGSSGDMDTGSFIGDNTVIKTFETTAKRNNILIYTKDSIANIFNGAGAAYAYKLLYVRNSAETDGDYAESLSNGSVQVVASAENNTGVAALTSTYRKNITFGEDAISITKAIQVATNVFANGIQYHWMAW